jgi:tRNA threonylcarbamoyladenosine biosynthesis protein TsaB
MLLLAVDTSGRQGGITLARGSSEQFEVIESASLQGGTFSAELIPQISELLNRNRLLPANLEGLVAVTGPGSFTGLRVGLTAVKGLAEALKLPIASVTSLEVLMAAREKETQRAAFLQERDAVIAVLDAGRDEVYAAIRSSGDYGELLLSVSSAEELARSRNLNVITSDANLASKFPAAEVVEYRSSEVAAQLGARKLHAGETVDVLALDANYIRKSEAEYMQKLKQR